MLNRVNVQTGLLEYSRFPCKPDEYKLFKVRRNDEEVPNCTIICLALRIFGPMHERTLSTVLLVRDAILLLCAWAMCRRGAHARDCVFQTGLPSDLLSGRLLRALRAARRCARTCDHGLLDGVFHSLRLLPLISGLQIERGDRIAISLNLTALFLLSFHLAFLRFRLANLSRRASAFRL